MTCWQREPWRGTSGPRSEPGVMLLVERFVIPLINRSGRPRRIVPERIPPFDISTYLLAEAQNLEALEVGQVLAALGAVGALREGALGPLAINLVLSPKLLHGTGTGSTGKLGDGEVSEGGVGERENVTGHDLLLLGGGTVDQDLNKKIASQYTFRLKDLQKSDSPILSRFPDS